MTEQEAIKKFKERLSIEDYRKQIPEYYEAMELAVKYMKEIQKYRAIGTIEKIKEELDRLRNDNDCQGLYFTLEERHDLARQRRELEEYRAIGTPEECREAMEKQSEKKPKEYEDKFYGCPVCGNVLLQKWEKYNTKLTDKKNGLPYCLGCGQKLDWSDEE